MNNVETAFVVATTICRRVGDRDFDPPEAIYSPTEIDRAEKLAILLSREGCWGVFEALVGDWDDRLLWPEQVNKLADYTDDNDDATSGDAGIALAQAHFACCHWAERLNLSLRVPRRSVTLSPFGSMKTTLGPTDNPTQSRCGKEYPKSRPRTFVTVWRCCMNAASRMHTSAKVHESGKR
ncbi:MAG: hypothetical protein AAGD32_13055 [Planctomycetota bacterium]